jgi:hypothetical protein
VKQNVPEKNTPDSCELDTMQQGALVAEEKTANSEENTQNRTWTPCEGKETPAVLLAVE